jgi:lipopolysaccharide heptosyltransferase II
LNLLLVRLRLIGDVVFTTPIVRALKRRYPGARITYLVEPRAAPVVIGNPHIDDVLVVEHTRGWRRLADDWRLGRALRRARFDAAIDLHGGPRSGWLTWMTRAPVRVGYDVAGRAWMYTRIVPRARELRPRHSVLNQWDLLGALDEAFQAPADPAADRVEMAVPAEARRAVDARLSSLGVCARDVVVVMHVSAGNPFRRWPDASFAALAAALVSRSPDRRVLLASGPSDRAAVARVLASARAQAPGDAGRILDAEGLSLPELRALMDRAALFIGGDSGPLHVAATSDVPVVGLYGPTLAERSAPWRPPGIPTVSLDAGALACRPCDQRRCEPGDFRCLSGITVNAVRDAAETVLESGR